MPRTFAFNRVLSVDAFKVEFLGTHHVLNMVDHGSNLQVCALLQGQTALEAWRVFYESWLRPFGPPQLLIVDGGSEFEGRFARGCEEWGILEHVIDADSPWQNGRCERHGGWVKERLEAELSTGSSLPSNVL